MWKNEPSEITGGYLIERDVPEYYNEDPCGFILSSGDRYVIKSPEYASEKQVNYIHSYLQEAYDAISAEDGCNPFTGKHYSEYIDVDSFALKYVLEEFLSFKDAGRSSAYYYKDANGLLCAGPGWDFGGACVGEPEARTYLNLTDYSTDWFKKLLMHPEFEEKVVRYYNELLVPAINDLLSGEFSQMQKSIGASVQMDEVRWQKVGFEQSCNDISEWIKKRSAFLSENLKNKDYFTVEITCEWQNKVFLHVKPNGIISIEQMPQYEWAEYEFAGWRDVETGELYDFSKPVTKDIVLSAVWEKTPQSLIKNLWSKASQMIPELIFFGIFGLVAIIYLTKTIKFKRRKKV